VDITIGADDVHLVDKGESAAGGQSGCVYRLQANGGLTRISTTPPILQPVAIAADPKTSDLYIMARDRAAVVRVNRSTGAVSTVISGITLGAIGGIDVSADGQQLIITDQATDAIYIFARK